MKETTGRCCLDIGFSYAVVYYPTHAFRKVFAYSLLFIPSAYNKQMKTNRKDVRDHRIFYFFFQSWLASITDVQHD